MKTKSLQLTGVSFLIFFCSWFLLYKAKINTLPIQSEDILPTMFLPVAITKEKTLYLDSYYEQLVSKYPHPDDKNYQRGLTPFYLKSVEINGTTRYLSAFPLITAFLIVPVYLLPTLFGMPVTFENLAVLGHTSSALLISLSGGILYLLARKHFSCDEKKALIISSVYLFGTINFSLLSQGLWQHGTVEFFTLIALWFLFEKKNTLTGLFLGLAVLARPTAFLLVPFFFLLSLGLLNKFNLKKALSNLVYIILGLVPSAFFFYWYTKTYYLGITNNGYSSQFLVSWLSPFPEGFLGMWFSPSKGILVYSPILVFLFVSMYRIYKNGNWRLKKNLKYVMFFSIVILHTLFLSIWKHWYGGYGFGYRMASDVLPFMVLLLIPYLKSNLYKKTKVLFITFFIISVLMQIQGLIFFDSIWHAAYDRGFRNTSWLWSLKDSETVFNIRRVLVKLGVLERACPQCLPL